MHRSSLSKLLFLFFFYFFPLTIQKFSHRLRLNVKLHKIFTSYVKMYILCRQLVFMKHANTSIMACTRVPVIYLLIYLLNSSIFKESISKDIGLWKGCQDFFPPPKDLCVMRLTFKRELMGKKRPIIEQSSPIKSGANVFKFSLRTS